MPLQLFQDTLEDGFSTIITIAAAGGAKIKEIEVTPPGKSMGGPVKQTTMRNTKYRTQLPKKLQELTEGGGVYAYHPSAYKDLDAAMGVNGLITYEFNDGSTYAFYGWLEEFKPTGLKEGDKPTAEIKIFPSLIDPANGNETEPVYTAGSAGF